MGMFYIILFIICLAFLFWQVTLPILLIILGFFLIRAIFRFIRLKRYFVSKRFLNYRDSYSESLYRHKKLASYINNIVRDLPDLGAYRAELSELKGEWPEPVRYLHVRDVPMDILPTVTLLPGDSLMRYFDIKTSDQTFEDLQRLALAMYRLRIFIKEAKKHEEYIIRAAKPPARILERRADEFWEQLGSEHIPEAVPRSLYKLRHVNRRGREDMVKIITLDESVLEELIEYMRFWVGLGQPSYLRSSSDTPAYRNVLERDGFICRGPECKIPYMGKLDWPLDVVHIIPPSEGGLTDPHNLVTMCWECGRKWENRETA